jgi:hypothetical protein
MALPAERTILFLAFFLESFLGSLVASPRQYIGSGAG